MTGTEEDSRLKKTVIASWEEELICCSASSTLSGGPLIEKRSLDHSYPFSFISIKHKNPYAVLESRREEDVPEGGRLKFCHPKREICYLSTQPSVSETVLPAFHLNS